MSVSTLGFKGKVIYWQLSTNGTTWLTAAALDKKSFKLDNEDIDTTNDTTPGNLKELSPGVQTPNTNIEGFAYAAAAPTGFLSLKEIMGYANSQTILYFRMVDNTTTPANMNITGTTYVKSIDFDLETNKYTKFKAELSYQTLTIV
jgi:predicted secreted protein